MFEELINITKDGEFELTAFYKGLRMQKHLNPVSIAEPEFIFLKNFIKENNLQRGFEVATAFGISALAMGLGFKEIGGKAVSMDAYIEEQFDDCSKYTPALNKKYFNADGFKTASFLLDYYKLNDVVTLDVGFSPDDTEKVIKSAFGDEKIDFAFIDALHMDEAVIRDAQAIIPHLSKRNVVFFHDLHCFTEGTKNLLSHLLGGELKVVEGCEHPGPGYNLAYISNL